MKPIFFLILIKELNKIRNEEELPINKNVETLCTLSKTKTRVIRNIGEAFWIIYSLLSRVDKVIKQLRQLTKDSDTSVWAMLQIHAASCCHSIQWYQGGEFKGCWLYWPLQHSLICHWLMDLECFNIASLLTTSAQGRGLFNER